MPIMTRSARHRDTTLTMTDSDDSLNDRGYFGVRGCSGHVTMLGRGEHRRTSGAGTGTPQLPHLLDGRTDEKSAVLLSESESCVPQSSSSSVRSRFVGRLGASMPSMPSLRTIPSWRSSLVPDAHETYARINPRYDSESSDSPSPPHRSRGIRPNRQSSSGDQRRSSLRRRRHQKRTRSQNNVLRAPIPFPSPLIRFPRMKSEHHDPDRSSRSSFNTYYRPSSDSHVPFPSISEESYPSPHSPDAVAVFQIPPGKSKTPLFNCFGKHHGISDDDIRVMFAESSDGTSSSASETSTTSVLPSPRQRGLFAPLRRRVSALASSVMRTRRKFATGIHPHRHSPNSLHDDNDPEEYDIPCLAYITCLW